MKARCRWSRSSWCSPSVCTGISRRLNSARLVPLLVLLVVGGGAGCDSVTEGDAGITDTYELESWNGSTVPWVVESNPGYTERLDSGYLTLNEDGTGTMRLTATETVDGESTTETDTYSFTYHVSGAALALEWEEGSGWGAFDSANGNVDGSTISLSLQGESQDHVLVFRK